METTLTDLLSQWADWPAELDRLLAESPAADRAHGIAELLRRLVPLAAGWGCRLEGAEHREGDAGDGAHRLTAAVGAAGELWLALPPSADRAAVRALRALLGLAAQALALRLEVEGLRQEQRESADLVTVGEAMIGLTHTVNNSLNTMVLQTATVQMRAPEDLRNDLGLVRREGAQAAFRLRPLQALRSWRAPDGGSDLNAAVAAALAPPSDLAGRVVFQPGADLPRVPLAPITLRRLVRLLLRATVPCHAGDRPLSLRTARTEQGAQLVLEADGPSGEAPAHLSDLPLALGGGMEELERIAAESMVKRLGGRIELKARPEGGLTVSATWSEGPRGDSRRG